MFVFVDVFTVVWFVVAVRDLCGLLFCVLIVCVLCLFVVLCSCVVLLFEFVFMGVSV